MEEGWPPPAGADTVVEGNVDRERTIKDSKLEAVAASSISEDDMFPSASSEVSLFLDPEGLDAPAALVSTDSCVSKGAICPEEVVQICHFKRFRVNSAKTVETCLRESQSKSHRAKTVLAAL